MGCDIETIHVADLQHLATILERSHLQLHSMTVVTSASCDIERDCIRDPASFDFPGGRLRIDPGQSRAQDRWQLPHRFAARWIVCPASRVENG